MSMSEEEIRQKALEATGGNEYLAGLIMKDADFLNILHKFPHVPIRSGKVRYTFPLPVGYNPKEGTYDLDAKKDE